MPRQPLLRLVPASQTERASITFGKNCLGQRPELEQIIAHCLMLWSTVEMDMALVLGKLLEAENAAAMVVFQALRRSSAQRDAISEAAGVVLRDADQELLSAALNVHKSVEAERNALAHGNFGIIDILPDALLWMNTTDYLPFVTRVSLLRKTDWTEDESQAVLAKVWVYRPDDLKNIYADIAELNDLWFNFFHYLQEQDQTRRAERYSQLCNRSRIAQALATIRQKNTPSIPALWQWRVAVEIK